ncbi:MAG: hemerythrin domain-containing protein [Desulfovibrionales bacterium]
MEPIGPLMHEHRLIERMVDLLQAEKDLIELGQGPDLDVAYKAVDFFRTYADRCHHGKEEDILFKRLKSKDLPPDLRARMDELIEDHKYGRKLVGSLEDAARRYEQGEPGATKDMGRLISELVRFYPDHIEKEDKHFFFPVLDFFSREERDAMLDEYWKFDRQLIHEKYAKDVDGLQERKKAVEQEA